MKLSFKMYKIDKLENGIVYFKNGYYCTPLVIQDKIFLINVMDLEVLVLVDINDNCDLEYTKVGHLDEDGVEELMKLDKFYKTLYNSIK